VIRLWRPGLFEPLHQRPLLVYAVAALLLGAQMMSIGFLAELITAYQGQDEHSYSIAETTPASHGKPEAPASQPTSHTTA
jgi:dolichol-phosphate mannosyltransferase